jgi:AcrR family transcriptional regulator
VAGADAKNGQPELRDALLTAATRKFLELPYEQVRVEDIVAEAGVAKGLAFYYFKSKRGLYIAVVQSLMIELAARTRPDLTLPPRARELAAVGGFVEWAAEKEGIEIILSTWSAGDPQIDAVFREGATQIIRQTMDAMGDFPGGPGSENELPAALLARSLWGWMAFARIVTADWLRTRDATTQEHRDLLVGALDGVVRAAHKVTDEKN